MSEKLTREVLKRIKPQDKKLLKAVDASLKQLNNLLKKGKVNAVAMVGGSIAKDTYLKGDHDCDVFVKFNYMEYKGKDISKVLGKVLKSLKPELVHGSRDYYFIKNEICYEIVPVLDITDPKKAENVTDMSPLHVEWVKKHKGLEDEIRLAKQFCKAAKVYGAESYIRGFSGHVLDILVVHYGGFEKFLKKAVKWKDKEVVDPEKFHKDALKEMNQSKTESPIIVVDPVLPDRNAAAAISYEKMERFKEAARSYLKEATLGAFKIKKVTKTELNRRAGKDRLVLIEAFPKVGKEDVVGAKLLKAMELLRNQMKFYDFDLKESGWEWDKQGKALFWYILDKKELIPIAKWFGPPLVENDRVENFKKKYAKTFDEKGRICTYVKRKYINVDQLIIDVFKDDLMKQKVKLIKVIN
ncbi:nucleotidyltransferase domain-containing protein [Nanoarchaeota archaeon]